MSGVLDMTCPVVRPKSQASVHWPKSHLYDRGLSSLLMRESAKKDKTHLPKDTYQEWLRSQKEKLSAKGRGKEVTENSFEAWMAKRVERRVKKTSGRARPKRKSA